MSFVLVVDPIVVYHSLPHVLNCFLHSVSFLPHIFVLIPPTPLCPLPGWINNPNLSADCRGRGSMRRDKERMRACEGGPTPTPILPIFLVGPAEMGAPGKVLQVALPAPLQSSILRVSPRTWVRYLHNHAHGDMVTHSIHMICTNGQGLFNVMCANRAIKKVTTCHYQGKYQARHPRARPRKRRAHERRPKENDMTALAPIRN